MNADHADAVGLFATRLLARGGEGWRMTGIDPEGIDLRRAGETARLDFAACSQEPVVDPAASRRALIALTRLARAGSTG
jgi:putative heme iron utilization protein